MDYDDNPWRSAILDELVCCHILDKKHEHDPKQALADIIIWNMRVAIDPAVSADADALWWKGWYWGLAVGWGSAMVGVLLRLVVGTL